MEVIIKATFCILGQFFNTLISLAQAGTWNASSTCIGWLCMVCLLQVYTYVN